MKIFDKKSPTKIEEDDLNDANLSVADFPDEITKKRAFINVLGARLAMKLFFSQKIEANNLYSLYTIHSLLEEFDIADIYYKNIKIDVRMIFNKDEIFIPKAQFEYELLPDLYAVLHLTEDMSSVEFLGFFEPKDLNKINANKDFYFYEYEYLQTPDKLKAFLDKFVPQNRPDQSENNLENAKELFLSLVDKEISQTDKKRLLKSLANDFSLREQMVEFENFETISKTITNKEELFQDELLDFAGTEGGDNLTLETASEPVAQEGEEFDFKKADEFSEEEINAWASDKTEEPIEEKINEPTVEATEEPIAQETEDFIFENANESIEEVVNDLPIETTDAPIAQEIEDFIFETENEPITQEINEQTFDTTAETIVQETEEFIFETQNESIEEEVNDLTVEPTNEPIVQEISNLTVGTTDEPIAKGLKNLTFETTNKSIAEGAEDLTFEKVGELFSEEANDLPFDKEDEPIEEGLKRFLPNVGLENELINKKEEGGVKKEEEEENIPPEAEIKTQATKTFEKLPDIEIIEEKAGTTEDEETLSLDDFDFNQLSGDLSSKEEPDDASKDYLFSLDDLAGTNKTSEPEKKSNNKEEEDDEEILKLTKEAEEAEEVNSNKKSPERKDEFINELDDFLEDIEKSPEKQKIWDDFSEFDEADNKTSTESTPEAGAEPEVIYLQKDDSEEDYTEGVEQPEKKNKDLIEVLFEKEKITNNDQVNLPKTNPLSELTKNKKMVIAASLATVIIVSSIIGGSLITKQGSNNTNIPPNAGVQAPPPYENPVRDVPQDKNANPTDLTTINPTQSQGLSPVNPDMGKASSDAFLSEPVTANISKIAWEVPEDIAYNDAFRKYLQIAGRSLKLNLQNALLLSTEMSYSDKVIVDLQLNKDGSVGSSVISVSSGSKQIDNIVLQNVNETLRYIKLPPDELRGQSAVVSLIINF